MTLPPPPEPWNTPNPRTAGRPETPEIPAPGEAQGEVGPSEAGELTETIAAEDWAPPVSRFAPPAPGVPAKVSGLPPMAVPPPPPVGVSAPPAAGVAAPLAMDIPAPTPPRGAPPAPPVGPPAPPVGSPPLPFGPPAPPADGPPAPPTAPPAPPVGSPVPGFPGAAPSHSGTGGTGGPGGPAHPGGPGPAAWQPDSSPAARRSKRRIITWSIVAAAVAVLAGGAAVAVTLINDSRDPAAQVEEYLDLLERGQAAQAAKLVDPAVADDTLLTDEVLGAADERIEVVSVETVDRTGESARVQARMSLAGEEFEHEFTVDRGAKEWLVLETWELNEPLVVEATIWLKTPMNPGASSATVTVAGAEAVLAEKASSESVGTVFVYPAVYEVAGGDLGKFLTSEGESLVARQSGEMPEVTISAELNSAFEEEILAQAAAYADGCVRVGGNEVVTSNMDSACPSITRNTRLSELKVSKYPKALTDVGAKSFRTEEYEFEVRSSSADARLDHATSSLSGEISWKDGKPSVTDASFGWW